MEIRTLREIDLNELLQVFNESFSDYFVPLRLTDDQLKGKIKAEKVDLNYSAGSYLDNRLTGFILHGFDSIDGKKVIYNAGTGVIPSQRGQGLTKKMYDFILPVLRAEKIDTLVLEVITQNIQAIKSYEKTGYKIDRKLLCYKGELTVVGNEEIEIREIQEFDWKKIKGFWDFSPSWQNSPRVLEELKDTNRSYGAFIEDQLAGYIVYNPLSKRVQQFGTDAKHRRKKIASTLFAHIKVPGTGLTIINVDEGSTATNEFLKKIGLEKFIEQLEMKLELNEYPG